jgi:serpin B
VTIRNAAGISVKMMKSAVLLLNICIMVMITIFFSGCLGSNPETKVTPPNQTPGEIGQNISADRSVVSANNRFALTLYSNLRKDAKYTNKTLFFSPFSISSALALTYEGARGSTADEIQSVFFFPNDSNQRRSGFGKLYSDINQGNSQFILKTANALWAEKTYPFLPDYINTARVYYQANATNLDFINQPDNSRITINTWVEDQTNNKIKDLISRGGINPLTRLVITNAVYFKGMWAKPFDKNETRDDIFNVTQGKTVPVRMMIKTDKESVFRYTETDILQVLEMPYATNSKKQVSMIVLLPKNNNLTSVEESITVEQLSELKNSSIRQRVNVIFPKFRFETRYGLPGTLISMGMPTAFTDRADFSGMDGTRNLFIGDVIHQAFIEVNEEGTEAAAATGVTMQYTSIRNESSVPVFRADHPFIFIIQDSENGNILFLGRVTDPNS